GAGTEWPGGSSYLLGWDIPTITERGHSVKGSPALLCLPACPLAAKHPAVGDEAAAVQPIGATGDRHEVIDGSLRQAHRRTVNRAVRHRATHDTDLGTGEVVDVVGDGVGGERESHDSSLVGSAYITRID